MRGKVTPAFLDWFVEVASLWAVWLTGAWLAEVALSRGLSVKLIPIAMTSALVAWAISHADLPKPIELPLLMVIGGAVTIVFATLPASALSLRLCGWCETLGQQSYTLYVCHFPIITLISARCFETSKERPAHAWLALYGGAAALVVSKACFHLCEAHFIRPRIRLENKPTTVSPPRGALLKVASTEASDGHA
ncbi:MAG TPA: hypothetical protein VK530_13040, partial [Candidatus Acidoferrum sp.]|nr:hypothetical protein [Candidatus Acidoferrum sp.]